jgi:hypothetical protein
MGKSHEAQRRKIAERIDPLFLHLAPCDLKPAKRIRTDRSHLPALQVVERSHRAVVCHDDRCSEPGQMRTGDLRPALPRGDGTEIMPCGERNVMAGIGDQEVQPAGFDFAFHG